MASQPDPEIVLYDLACTKNDCFSPAVWRIRMLLNYKKIPYKTIFLEFPDIEPTLEEFGLHPANLTDKHTVPAIHHLPTNTYLMDSFPIAQFLESTYPNPPITLTSALDDEIDTKLFALIRPAYVTSIVPREIKILLPRSQEYFRRTREAVFGCRLEDLLEGDKEERAWQAVDEGMGDIEVGLFSEARKAGGPFLLGSEPSYVDFRVAGSLQAARVVNEGVFEGMMKYPGLRGVYEACVPFMGGRDK